MKVKLISDALSRALMSSLVDLAGRSGMRRMVGTMLSENAALTRLARSLGFSLSSEPEAAFVTNLEIDLDTRHSGPSGEA
ncbi:hypothetical protein [Burkholderia ubonensis]|uniref:hypothetical protein n=1 Tax=Burkholderia ubonensis TaxID=101571 RepID=UPI0007593A9C|nr:hypothetical protein [Burkholderia ubonensis]KVO26621.1 hypothetical protein WJ72_24105 [Burkholderia ubonensis]